MKDAKEKAKSKLSSFYIDHRIINHLIAQLLRYERNDYSHRNRVSMRNEIKFNLIQMQGGHESRLQIT